MMKGKSLLTIGDMSQEELEDVFEELEVVLEEAVEDAVEVLEVDLESGDRVELVSFMGVGQ